jgi:hypothetical protein
MSRKSKDELIESLNSNELPVIFNIRKALTMNPQYKEHFIPRHQVFCNPFLISFEFILHTIMGCFILSLLFGDACDLSVKMCFDVLLKYIHYLYCIFFSLHPKSVGSAVLLIWIRVEFESYSKIIRQ